MVTLKTDFGGQLVRHKRHAATNTQRQNLYFNYMTYKRPYLIWNALKSYALTICVK